MTETKSESKILIDVKNVCSLLDVSTTTLWRLRHDPTFPKGIKLTASPILWQEGGYDEVKQWCDNLKGETLTNYATQDQ